MIAVETDKSIVEIETDPVAWKHGSELRHFSGIGSDGKRKGGVYIGGALAPMLLGKFVEHAETVRACLDASDQERGS